MSNTRVASGTGYAGALIGWVDGKTKLENVRVYLSDLSVTKYKTAKEVPGYINGTYAGGMVGLVDTLAMLYTFTSGAPTQEEKTCRDTLHRKFDSCFSDPNTSI